MCLSYYSSVGKSVQCSKLMQSEFILHTVRCCCFDCQDYSVHLHQQDNRDVVRVYCYVMKKKHFYCLEEKNIQRLSDDGAKAALMIRFIVL